MKFVKIVLVLVPFTLYLLPSLAQAPEKMSYQAVIRNSSNNLVTNTQIGMLINIRQGAPGGSIVYSETKTPTTNTNGLVSVEIGGGTGFDTINWGSSTYFIETKVDPTGGSTYSINATSQLLSVPYALHAKTVSNFNLPFYTQEQIDSLKPELGMFIYNSTYNYIQFYSKVNGDNLAWADIDNKCVPAIQYTNDVLYLMQNDDSTIKLSGAIPRSKSITSKWSVYSGPDAGSFSDDTKFNSSFTGKMNSYYILEWRLQDPCYNAGLEYYIVGFGILTFDSIQLYPRIIAKAVEYGGYNQTINAFNQTDGRANSTAIITAIGAGNYAAKYCDTLNVQGFNDWYLPAIEELKIVLPYIEKVNPDEGVIDWFWSSTAENDDDNSMLLYQDGSSVSNERFSLANVICVRRK